MHRRSATRRTNGPWRRRNPPSRAATKTTTASRKSKEPRRHRVVFRVCMRECACPRHVPVASVFTRSRCFRSGGIFTFVASRKRVDPSEGRAGRRRLDRLQGSRPPCDGLAFRKHAEGLGGLAVVGAADEPLRLSQSPIKRSSAPASATFRALNRRGISRKRIIHTRTSARCIYFVS